MRESEKEQIANCKFWARKREKKREFGCLNNKKRKQQKRWPPNGNGMQHQYASARLCCKRTMVWFCVWMFHGCIHSAVCTVLCNSSHTSFCAQPSIWCSVRLSWISSLVHCIYKCTCAVRYTIFVSFVNYYYYFLHVLLLLLLFVQTFYTHFIKVALLNIQICVGMALCKLENSNKTKTKTKINKCIPIEEKRTLAAPCASKV